MEFRSRRKLDELNRFNDFHTKHIWSKKGKKIQFKNTGKFRTTIW